MYRTGDRARLLPDGNIEFLGRLDSQVKLRGFRIELGEIEAQLASHPEVVHCVVIVREDRPGDQRLVGYVVPRQALPEAAALKQHLRVTLPEYMLPQHFLALPAIPLLPNGKVDRKALPAPADETPAAHEDHAEPVTPAGQTIAQVWRELLGSSVIRAADNFFDLGGHSLLAMRAVSEIEKRLHVRIDVRRLIFESLAQIAASCDAPAPVQPAETLAAAASAAARDWLGRVIERWRRNA